MVIFLEAPQPYLGRTLKLVLVGRVSIDRRDEKPVVGESWCLGLGLGTIDVSKNMERNSAMDLRCESQQDPRTANRPTSPAVFWVVLNCSWVGDLWIGGRFGIVR